MFETLLARTLAIAIFAGAAASGRVRTAGEQLGGRHLQNELRLLSRPGRTWERCGKELTRIFTRRKSNSSQTHNWLALSLKGEEICLLSTLA